MRQLSVVIMVALLGVLTWPVGAQPKLSPEQETLLRDALQLPPGSVVELEYVERDEGSEKITETGKGVGAGGWSEGDRLSDSLTGSAPETSLPSGGSAKGGDVQRTAKGDAFIAPASLMQNPMLWVGILLLVGAAVLLWMKLPGTKGLAINLGALGGGLIVAAMFPAILIWVVAGIALYMAWPYIKARLGQERGEVVADRMHEALRAVLGGLQDPAINEETRDRVWARIRTQLETGDQEILDEVIRSDGLLPAK